MGHKGMKKRNKRRREQARRTVQHEKPRKALSPQAQAKDNEARVAYLEENYTRIRDGVEAYKNDNNGRMPAIIVLLAKSQQIVMADKLEPFVTGAKTMPGLDVEALQRDMVKRDYTGDDCLLLVEAGHGILRTSFATATLRHELRDSGARFVSVGM